MNREDVAWAAGVFEGEGSFLRNGRSISCQMGMTDPDVVFRFSNIVGVGSIKVKTLKSGKEFYKWQYFGFERCQFVVGIFWKYLGLRRRSRATELLAFARVSQIPSILVTHCPKGHEYSISNTIIYDGRRCCKTCRGYKVA